MTPAVLADQIFSVLYEFDRTVQPFGLYSVSDIPSQPNPQKLLAAFESQMALREDLKDVAAFGSDLRRPGSWGIRDAPRFSLEVPDFGATSLQMVRISKVKVRRYGPSYRLDRHKNYDERWERLEFDKQIHKIRHRTGDNDWQCLLFLGFDKAQRPFEREMSELKPHQERARYGIEYFERVWDDSMGRGFKVKVALWMRDFSSDESPSS